MVLIYIHAELLDSGSVPLMHEQKLKKHQEMRLQMTESKHLSLVWQCLLITDLIGAPMYF